jgi:teichuronic acid biosynthesis glycosyltransferase TuaG
MSTSQLQKRNDCPLISVVMPVHNGAATLNRAIESVEAQTFPDWELLVVDDASTDNCGEALKAWADKDSRIRPFSIKENGGPSVARNIALRHARGEFIAYLDHDDEYYRDYLEGR